MNRSVRALLITCQALSILHAPGVLAQTTPVKDCIRLEHPPVPGVVFAYNTCDEGISVFRQKNHQRLTIQGVCTSSSSGHDALLHAPADNSGGRSTFISLLFAPDTLPGKVCVEYADSDRQRASGYQTCSTLSFSDCGSSGLTLAFPDRLPPPAGTIVLSSTQTSRIAEGGSGSFDISLSTRPDWEVTITFENTNTDISLSPNSLTFTPSNYGTAQSLTVSAAEDADAANDSDLITIEAAGGLDAPSVSKSILVIDNDNISTGRIVLSPAQGLTIAEGNSGNFSVSLSNFPNVEARVSLSTSSANITLSESSLTFTRSNYAQAQSITVSAAEDDDAADESETITLQASGGITAPSASLSVSVEDDESVRFLLAPESLTIIEGQQGTFRVRPATRPSGDISVTITSSNTAIAVVDTDPSAAGNQNTLSFSRSLSTNAWDRSRTVSVEAVHDVDTNDESLAISLVGSGGDYQGTTGRISVSVSDDDGISGSSGDIVLSDTETLTIDEGGSGSFDVRLSAPPNADAIVSLSTTSGALSLSPTSLTFDASNYSIPRAVTVSAPEDDDETNESDTITLEVSGGFDAPTITKSVQVIDNDAGVGFDLNPTSLSLDEGGQSGFRLRLASRPSADITVHLSVSDSSIVIDADPLEEGNQTTLRFDRLGQTYPWDRYRRVNVEAAHDDDSNDESVEISLRGAGGNYEGETARVSVSVTDDDDDDNRPSPPSPPSPPPPPLYPGGVVVSPAILTLGEGKRADFSVALDTAPTSNVTIELSKGNPDVNLASSAFTFTPSSWSKSVQVAVVASEDADATSDSDTIDFVAADPNGLAARDRKVHSLAVFVVDNDSPPRRAPIKAQALAIPPPDSGDDMTLRIRCNQDSPCSVILDCSTQVDGSVYEGSLPEAIPGFGARSLSADDIRRYTGWMPSATQGRLGCALRSDEKIGSQVWTRSGADVLVNNSAFIRSVPSSGGFRADIESIPSPDSFDESNIRIRCNSSDAHCADIRFFCYTDDGARYETTFEGLARKRTLHLQSQALATRLGTRWPGLGLACELRASASFTVQVLTRTGGGGALINNSTTGIERGFARAR